MSADIEQRLFHTDAMDLKENCSWSGMEASLIVENAPEDVMLCH